MNRRNFLSVIGLGLGVSTTAVIGSTTLKVNSNNSQKTSNLVEWNTKFVNERNKVIQHWNKNSRTITLTPRAWGKTTLVTEQIRQYLEQGKKVALYAPYDHFPMNENFRMIQKLSDLRGLSSDVLMIDECEDIQTLLRELQTINKKTEIHIIMTPNKTEKLNDAVVLYHGSLLESNAWYVLNLC
jgi:predicted AAA+ superfamily ATPase